jgi:hypothetical protein
VSAEIPCEEGVVVAVRVLVDKSTYNQLELPSGRMAQVKKGDVIAGALGHRNALFGYSGYLPRRLAPGERLNLLNLGGVLGICDSVNPDLGPPFECEVLGAVLHFPYLGERIGVAARIGAGSRSSRSASPASGASIRPSFKRFRGSTGSRSRSSWTATALEKAKQYSEPDTRRRKAVPPHCSVPGYVAAADLAARLAPDRPAARGQDSPQAALSIAPVPCGAAGRSARRSAPASPNRPPCLAHEAGSADSPPRCLPLDLRAGGARETGAAPQDS